MSSFREQELEREQQERAAIAAQAEARSRQLAAPGDLPHEGESDRPGHWRVRPVDHKQWIEAGWAVAGTINGGTEPLFVMRQPTYHQTRRS